MLQFALIALLVTETFHRTSAMGFGRFARIFPCNEKVCPLSAKLTGCNKAPFLTFTYVDRDVTTDHTTNIIVTTENFVSTTAKCLPNMKFVNCTEKQLGTCQDPLGSTKHCTESATCVCAAGFLKKENDCVPQEECGCFIDGVGVIPANELYINHLCSEKCNCADDTLICTSYKCSNHASCKVEQNIRGCYCNEGYEGDGETCTALPTDCLDAFQTGHRQDGVYTILPTGWPGSPFNVSCDMTTAGGGWTIFQRRTDGVTSFYRNWAEYRVGFGSVHRGNDFWLGNEQLYYLTNQKNYKLRVDIVDSGGTSRYSEYQTFRIGDERTKYRLSISGHSGNTGDGMGYSNDGSFSTLDQDNDGCSLRHCATSHKAAWWYTNTWCRNCWTSHGDCHAFESSGGCHNLCTFANLNGNYNGLSGQNINWLYETYCRLNFTEMKICPF